MAWNFRFSRRNFRELGLQAYTTAPRLRMHSKRSQKRGDRKLSGELCCGHVGAEERGRELYGRISIVSLTQIVPSP
jgi:hypothetical protein